MQKFFLELPENQRVLIAQKLVAITGITLEQALTILAQQNYFYRFDEFEEEFKCLQPQQYASLAAGLKYLTNH